MNVKVSKLQTIIEYSILTLVSIGFLLLFSLWTTPLLPKWYGCDASFFSMAGRGILHGWVPYEDFFDLKGPYFFFLQALGQLMCQGRFGIFLLQIPFLSVSLILIYRMALLYLSKKQAVFVLASFLFLHIAMLWGGNTLEEYCLPFNLLCMYTALRLMRDDDFESLSNYAFLYGVCFGFITFCKITTAAPVIGITAAFALLLLLRKQYRQFWLYIGSFFCGLILIMIPLFIYFGMHGALKDMFYAVFVFAFKRSVDFAEPYNLSWELKCFGCVFAFLFALLYKKELRSPERLVLIITAGVTYVALHFGTPFVYYFTTSMPVFLAALILFIAVNRPFVLGSSYKQLICVAALIVLFVFYEDNCHDTLMTAVKDRDNTAYDEYYQNATDLAVFIPEWERNDVYCFNVDMIWFEINDILPCYRYPVNTPFFIALDETIGNNLRTLLDANPPRWLVTSNNIHDEIDFVGTALDEKYVFIYSNDLGSIYLLNENKEENMEM